MRDQAHHLPWELNLDRKRLFLSGSELTGYQKNLARELHSAGHISGSPANAGEHTSYSISRGHELFDVCTSAAQSRYDALNTVIRDLTENYGWRPAPGLPQGVAPVYQMTPREDRKAEDDPTVTRALAMGLIEKMAGSSFVTVHHPQLIEAVQTVFKDEINRAAVR